MQRGDREVEYMKIQEQLANILTKLLGRLKMEELQYKVGINNVKLTAIRLRE